MTRTLKKPSDVSPKLVADLRIELIGQGCGERGYSDHMLKRLLVKMPDAELAATAVAMTPRPSWVVAIVGSR